MPPESTAETTPADSTHNHPARCCCEPDHDDDGTPSILNVILCPRCPWHGDGAPAAECPSCHTADGHPHTDYCQAVAPAEYPGQPDHCTYAQGGPIKPDPRYLVGEGGCDYPIVCRRCFGYGVIVGPDETQQPCPDCAAPACAYPAANNGDGRGCEHDDCPKHGGSEASDV